MKTLNRLANHRLLSVILLISMYLIGYVFVIKRVPSEWTAVGCKAEAIPFFGKWPQDKNNIIVSFYKPLEFLHRKIRPADWEWKGDSPPPNWSAL